MPADRNPAHQTDPDAAAVARGYEARDVRVGIVAVLFGGFAVLFAVLCGGLWAFYHFELKAAAAPKAPLSAVSSGVVTSDAPPLQPQVGHDALDAWDLARMRANEDSVFERMGWTRDPKTHRFVVPANVVGAMGVPKTPPAGLSPATSPGGGR